MRVVSSSPGMDQIGDASRDDGAALVSRMQSRGSNNVYWVDTVAHTEVNLTTHEGPGTFDGRFAPDAHTVNLISNKDPDRTPCGKERLGPHGESGPTRLVAHRADATAADFESKP